MGKGKQKFNKKQAVRFTLVPGFDQNGKPITHFRPVQTKKSKVNPSQRQKIIRQISDQTYDQIQINGRLVGQNQIPAFVLQQIKGRKDLVFNEKMLNRKQQKQQHQGDLYDVIEAKDYDDNEQFASQEQEWIDEQDIIDEEQFQEYDDEQMQEGDQEWEDQEMMGQQQILDQQTEMSNKPFKINEEEFPVLNKVNIQGKQYELTQQQIKLLDVLLPQNYQNFQIKGINFQKYDQNGLPLSQKAKYQHFLATGNQGIVDSFDYVPQNPTPIFDTDLKPSQITGQVKEIQDALNFQGQEGAYEELQDDFFAKLIQSEIQTNKKQKKPKKQKPKKVISKTIKPEPTQIKNTKLPKQLEMFGFKKQENIFAKYDELDEDILQDQITDEMLDKALDDFEHNLQPKQGVKITKNNHHLEKHIDEQEEMEQNHSSGNNVSMSFSQLQKCPQFFGKDGELDWRCLTKKQKKEYMRTKIIRSFYDQVRQRQIQEKLKGKKNITSEELHLKSIVKHLTFEQDHVMRKALEQDAKQEVDLDQDSSYESSSQEQNIIEYHQRTSVISSNLNEISQPSKKKPKKKKQDDQQRLKQLDQLSQTLSKLKASSQKRNRNETKEERKQRKQKQKQLKKQKKQVKKQFNEKFNQERKKHIKMTKPSDPLHKVAYVKII